MKAFAAAYRSIDGTTKTHQKLAVMREYFLKASSQDAAWAVYFLSGERFKRVVPAKALREWALESASISEWLFEESYGWVGDLAETISLLVPSPATTTEGSLTDWIEKQGLSSSQYTRRRTAPSSAFALATTWSGRKIHLSEADHGRDAGRRQQATGYTCHS